jgi:hypothetical protein
MDRPMSSYINECLKQVDYIEGIDYGQVLKVRRQFINRNKNTGNTGNWFS